MQATSTDVKLSPEVLAKETDPRRRGDPGLDQLRRVVIPFRRDDFDERSRAMTGSSTAREMLLGVPSVIVNYSNSHGLCFEVSSLTPALAVSAWFDAEELHPVNGNLLTLEPERAPEGTGKRRTITVQLERSPDEVEITLDPQGRPLEPRCTSCECLVTRPKCAFELGGDCPRHPQVEAYKRVLDKHLRSRVATTVLEFYRDGYVSIGGKTYGDMVRMTLEEKEEVHNYIQWLFPTDEPSQFSYGPLVDKRTINAFRRGDAAGRKLKYALLNAFDAMLRFYGLVIVGGIYTRDEKVLIKPATFDSVRELEKYNWVARADNWLTPNNHNHLRLTRIIRSLRLLGCKKYAVGLHRCLIVIAEEVWKEEVLEAGKWSGASLKVEEPLPIFTDETLQYWKDALK